MRRDSGSGSTAMKPSSFFTVPACSSFSFAWSEPYFLVELSILSVISLYIDLSDEVKESNFSLIVELCLSNMDADQSFSHMLVIVVFFLLTLPGNLVVKIRFFVEPAGDFVN